MKMSGGCRLVIVGATGEVGRAVLSTIEDASLSLAEVHVLASANSAEETLMYNSRPLLVGDLEEFDFAAADIAIFAAPADVARKHVPRARAAGCRVIDHSAAFRLESEVPLLIEGMPVPAADLVACPDALVALLVPVLQSAGSIRSAQLTVLEPVSAAGRRGVRELAGQTGELLNGRGIEATVFPAQIAFNALPAVGNDRAGALMDELERVLPDSFPVAVAAVGVPVFYGLTVAVTLLTDAPLNLDQLRARLEKASIEFGNSEEEQGLVTPVTEASGRDGVYVTGMQSLPAPLEGVQLWLVGDNLRQGAARQSLYVLEKWIKDFKY
jgi:aspartate-semialdehyde dehydrogenase